MTAGVAGQAGVREDLPVTGVSAAVYEVPTDQPEADGTLTWS